MKKRLIYAVKGCFTSNDLPIEKLVDIEELIYFRKIEPIYTNSEPSIFRASDLESIALETYLEYLKAVDSAQHMRKFNIHEYPYLHQKLNYFLFVHEQIATNTVFLRFLEEDHHTNVFVVSLIDKSSWSDKLDQLFREFYFEYRFISFISQTLYYEAIHYDKKIRKEKVREQTVLYESSESTEDYNLTLLDKIESKQEIEPEIYTDSFAGHIENVNLYQAFKGLTERQQTILYEAYVRDMKDVEISKKLNISQQSVSKTRKVALLSLRKMLQPGVTT